MYLKKLSVLGFKSFANKTTVKFSDGVTAIVGPNGCGKTNVLDALRWVLGEQKPTLLRGGKMEEVIFNGTRDTKPLGMAEVNLMIMNDRGILPTEYNEVQITRRLFRSGDSEYLINKVPCRLKDITDLFVDTGMGAHSYSVIQPDMVEAVISDRAEERRFLFEEAAGITQYKQRRKAALRKLDATENDLLRLKDIYAEVKTRVNSLYRQHKKAERFKRVTDEIRQWDIYLGSKRVNQLTATKRELKAESDDLAARKLDRETSLDGQTAGLEADRKELIDIEHRLNELGNKLYLTSEKAHGIEREISVLAEKKTNAESLIARNTDEIKNLQERLDTLTGQHADVQSHLSQQEELLKRFTAQFNEAERIQAESDDRLVQARSARENENGRLVELESKLSSGRTEESSLREQTEELANRLKDIDLRLEDVKPKQGLLIERLSEKRKHLDSLIGKRQELDRRRSELSHQMDKLAESSEELSLEIANLNASVEACEARRRLLEEMMLQFEGYESGVVTVMENRERWPGLIGAVADMFVPVEGMESAVEAALGDMARFVVCRDRECAEDIIAYLKADGKGRIGLLVPQTGALSPGVKRPEFADMPGVVGWLDTFVNANEPLRHLKDAILARTIVFEPGTDPSPILERLPFGFTAVSTDGTVYGQNLISGGSDDRFSLFRRKEKVQEQERLIAEQTERLQAMSTAKSRTVAELASSRADFNELINHQDELAERIESLQKEVGECDFEDRSLAAEFGRLRREKQTITQKLEHMRGRQGTLELDFSELSSRKDSLMASLEESGSQLEMLEHAATEAVEQVSRAQVAVIESRSKIDQINGQISHIEQIRGEIEETIQTKNDEIGVARSEIHDASQKTISLEDSLSAAYEHRDESTDLQKQTREIQAELMEKVAERESSVKQLRTEKEQLGENLHEVEIRLNTIDSEIHTIIERTRDEHETDITQAAPLRPDEKISDDEAPERLVNLKERLKKFGAVNLLALEEYQEASEREKFLKEQLADLEAAQKDLKSTISKINQTARKLFADTMASAQEHFRTLFVELFSGGEADIKLLDPTDPLESDIEIIARPPGKKLLSITMMSGGERALTAIALLFSLYLVKPSPFCILDEIDAPLDDANCHRFLKIIRNFSQHTQFIIITHNKITMETADNLYGITMEQPGVSKVVAVRFATEDENGETRLVTENLPAPVRERINPEIAVKQDDGG
ncbi:MAG: chromosome segregation protein SMC [Candidatus Zixiibacteriota bacterium]|nr:MAG: chromosome segregation protein SMC [candidate division Zixibacteria bacterium]